MKSDIKYCGISREVYLNQQNMSSFPFFSPLLTGCNCDSLVIPTILDHVDESLNLRILEATENLSTTKRALDQVLSELFYLREKSHLNYCGNFHCSQLKQILTDAQVFRSWLKCHLLIPQLGQISSSQFLFLRTLTFL